MSDDGRRQSKRPEAVPTRYAPTRGVRRKKDASSPVPPQAATPTAPAPAAPRAAEPTRGFPRKKRGPGSLARASLRAPSVAPPPMPLSDGEFLAQIPLGTRVGAHYVVESLLGAGGMGVVFRARDERLMRTVALKFVQPHFIAEDGTYERFLGEARALARISHPNVVDVYAFGEHQGFPYLVMEFIDGHTAEAWFVERLRDCAGLIPIDEALGILDQCCAGVAAIHAAGAVHGDLKPTNVLLDRGYRAVLADFGLAMLLDTDTRCHGGTPEYMAPETFEELEDRALIQRRDIFALGVMAYELLVGARPFPSRSIQQLDDLPAPAPPSYVRPDLGAAFDAPILTALAPDPHARTLSAERFRQELNAARQKVGRPTRRSRILVIDDDGDFTLWFERMVHNAFPDAEVVCCSSGEAGLRELLAAPTDIAFVDMRLPDMNGLELTSEIRAQQELERLNIQVITAHGTAADWKLLAELGANGFLLKPITVDALGSAIERALATQRVARRAG
jgi:eukaryotic-like serine/threonine-protein kinase